MSQAVKYDSTHSSSMLRVISHVPPESIATPQITISTLYLLD